MKQMSRQVEPRGGTGAHYFEAALKKAQYAIEDSRLDRATSFLHEAFGHLTDMARAGGSEARRSALGKLLAEIRSIPLRLEAAAAVEGGTTHHAVKQQQPQAPPSNATPKASLPVQVAGNGSVANGRAVEALEAELSHLRLIVSELRVQLDEARHEAAQVVQTPILVLQPDPAMLSPHVVATTVADAAGAAEHAARALSDKIVLIKARGQQLSDLHRLANSAAAQVLTAVPQALAAMAKSEIEKQHSLVDSCKIQAVALIHLLRLLDASADRGGMDHESGLVVDVDENSLQVFFESMASLVDEQLDRFAHVAGSSNSIRQFRQVDERLPLDHYTQQ